LCKVEKTDDEVTEAAMEFEAIEDASSRLLCKLSGIIIAGHNIHR